MQPGDPKEQQLFSQLCQAREKWERASDKFSEAMKMVQDLGPSSDSSLALEKARRVHRQTLLEYIEALNAHAAYVLKK